MTAQELYERDPGFRGFIAVWCADRRCPLELVDYLLDRDMHSQSDCARWMHEGDQWESWQLSDGTAPTLRVGRFPWLVCGLWRFKVCVDAASLSSRRAHRIPLSRLRDSWIEEEICGGSAAECILAVMDRWVPRTG